MFQCFHAKTGQVVFPKARIHSSAQRFTASPWYSNGKIFCLSEDGDTFVLQAGDEFKFLGKNTLNGEMCMATPALLGDRLVIRTQGHLFCLKEGAQLTGK
jgi:outer membrane protein assembly factor BamB